MENVLKSWFTTLLGAAVMVLAIYEYWIDDNMTIAQAGIMFAAGFALMWMRDSISGWIGQLFGVLVEKIKGK